MTYYRLRFYFIALCCLCLPHFGASQVDFIDMTKEIIFDRSLKNGMGLSVNDLNGDGLDDIISFENDMLYAYLQQSSGQYFREVRSYCEIRGEVYAILSAHIYQNQYKEIVIFSEGKFSILEYDGDQYRFKEQEQISYYPQAANLVDIDGDGALEIFVCNDIGTNVIYHQNADGKYVIDDSYDLSTAIPSDDSGNYGSVWADFDNDGDQDLYVAKCSIHAPDDATDPRRINQYFENIAGNLVLKDDDLLSDGAQSWSVDAADVNNDGWIDLFYTNHGDVPHVLLLNNKGEFIKSNFRFDPSNSFQSIIEDFNNDGWKDIVISSSSEDVIYWNRGNGASSFDAFMKQAFTFSGNTYRTTTIGDLDNDGYYDLMGSAASKESSSKNLDKLLINQSVGNDYIKFLLHAEDNRDITGTRIEVYQDGMIQVKELHSGFSYGISSSSVFNFGLGSAEVDSVVIYWSNGSRELLNESLDPNNTYEIFESRCVNRIPESEVFLQCPYEDEYQVDLPEDVIWENGSVTNSRTFDRLGQYTYRTMDEQCPRIAGRAVVSRDIDEEAPLFYADSSYLCIGDTLMLGTTIGGAMIMESGDVYTMLSVTKSGTYHAAYTNACDEIVYDSIRIDHPPANMLELDTMYINRDSLITIDVGGDGVTWYDEYKRIIGSEPFIEYFFDHDTTILYYRRDEFAYEKEQASSPYLSSDGIAGELFNSGMYFDVTHAMKLNSVSVEATKSGFRKILLYHNEEVIFSKFVNLEKGVNDIALDVHLDPSNGYLLTTDQDVNIQQLGHKGPAFKYYLNDVYPWISDDDAMVLRYSRNGTTIYPYFINWNTSRLAYDCPSDYHQVMVINSKLSHVIDFSHPASIIYPNPSSGRLNIQEVKGFSHMRIFDLSGALVHHSDEVSADLNLKSGLYTVIIYRKDGTLSSAKWVVNTTF